ncbi:hypothetical protein V6Z11_D12G158800 [Gossypium hirsutum]
MLKILGKEEKKPKNFSQVSLPSSDQSPETGEQGRHVATAPATVHGGRKIQKKETGGGREQVATCTEDVTGAVAAGQRRGARGP